MLLLNKVTYALYCRSYINKYCLHCSSVLSQGVSEKIHENNRFEKPTTHTIKIQSRIKRNLNPEKSSFAKDLFKSVVDTSIFKFPEIFDKDQTETLKENVVIIDKIIKGDGDSVLISKDGIPKKILKTLKDLRLFGQRVPVEYDGLEFTSTEYARMMEVLSQDISTALMQFNHEILCVKSIATYGSERQKEKYLQKLAAGEQLATYCINEPNICPEDIFRIKTTAFRGKDGHWYLNGTKSFVFNAKNSDLFVVLARTVVSAEEKDATDKEPNLPYFYYNENDFYDSSLNNYDPDRNEKQYLCNNVTAFLIEKQFNGIQIKESQTLGLNGLNLSEIIFTGTKVTNENILGKVNEGDLIAIENPKNDRHILGCIAMSGMKSLINDITNYVVTAKYGGKKLSNHGLIRMKLSEMAVNLYAMESMVYMTCGLLDNYENPDCAVESAIVKVFCSKIVWDSLNECLKIRGLDSYLKNNYYSTKFADLFALSLFDMKNDILKYFIAGMGLQHVANEVSERVIQQRNPYMYPNEFLKMVWEERFLEVHKPKLKLKLYKFLHPSLKELSNKVEHLILRFSYEVNTCFVRHGYNIVNKQMYMTRVADCIINIYAMIAILSRVSKSCTLKSNDYNHKQELLIANLFIQEKFEEVTYQLDAIDFGEWHSTDNNLEQIADKSIRSFGYFPAHPLKNNHYGF